MEERMKGRPGERILLWFLLMFSLFALLQAFRISKLESLSSPGAFPIFICAVLVQSTIWMLWKNWNRYSSFGFKEEIVQARVFVFPKTVFIYATILILYILLLAPLHFFVSSYLFLVGSFIFLKGTSIRRSFFVAAGMLAAIYLLFQYIFKVILW